MMNRDAPLLLRLFHPTTILFFVLITLYAVLVESGVLEPVELALRAWPLPRWGITLGFYVVLLVIVALFYRLLSGRGQMAWFDALSINRGGVALYDFLLLVATVAMVYLAWRYYGVWDRELLSIAAITAITALAGIARRPPWANLFIFQRSSNPAIEGLVPTEERLGELMARGDLARWQAIRATLAAANPSFNNPRRIPGEELFVPSALRVPPAGAPPAVAEDGAVVEDVEEDETIIPPQP